MHGYTCFPTSTCSNIEHDVFHALRPRILTVEAGGGACILSGSHFTAPEVTTLDVVRNLLEEVIVIFVFRLLWEFLVVIELVVLVPAAKIARTSLTETVSIVGGRGV